MAPKSQRNIQTPVSANKKARKRVIESSGVNCPYPVLWNLPGLSTIELKGLLNMILFYSNLQGR